MYCVHISSVMTEMISIVRELLDRGISINFYMFHGGTSFGFMNGAVDLGTYKPQTSSYGSVVLIFMTTETIYTTIQKFVVTEIFFFEGN